MIPNDKNKDLGKEKDGVPENNIVKKESSNEKIIPVLRTYAGDRLDAAKTKGGSELRDMLVKEVEERRSEEKKLKKAAKELLKESAVLRDKESFLAREKKKKDDVFATPVIKALEQVDRQEEENLSAKPVSEEKDNSIPFAGFFEKLNKKEKLSKQDKEILKEKEEEIVQKENLRNAWKDFNVKKEKLYEQGLKARDVRSLSTEIPKNTSFRKNSILSVIIFIFIFIGFLAISFIAQREVETPGEINRAGLQPTRDVINSEAREEVNVSIEFEEEFAKGWSRITSPGSQNVVTNFVPYVEGPYGKYKISLQELFDVFGIEIGKDIDGRLFETFGEYYFIGKYVTNQSTNSILIIPISQYGDALVRTLSWEIKSFEQLGKLFPNTISPIITEKLSVEKRIIDNKDVRVLSNSSSEKKLFYYFFNRSLLIFIVGSEDVIPQLNNRIRSTNSQITTN